MNDLYRAVATVLVFSISGWMLKMWLGHQERLRAMSMQTKDLGVLDVRMERVEHAVESIALEVERISEGQRYVTRLLSVPGATMPVSRRTDTPH